MKKKYLIPGIGLILIGSLVAYSKFFKEKESNYDFIEAKKVNLVQEVSVTGRIESVKNVDLAFEVGGKVSEVRVDVGNNVNQGDSLIWLDASELKAQLRLNEAEYESALSLVKKSEVSVKTAEALLDQSRSTLKIQEIKLEEIKKGTRAEEIKIAETKVSNAEKSLEDAKTNLEKVKNKADSDLKNLYDDVEDILNEAYLTIDDTLNKQIDDMFSTDNPAYPEINFSTNDKQTQTRVETTKRELDRKLASLKNDIENLPTDYDGLDNELTKTENYLMEVRLFLERLNDVILAAVSLSQTTQTTYLGYANTSRSNINTSLSEIATQIQLIGSQKITNENTIFTAETKVNETENALSTAIDELDLKKAGSTENQINAQEQAVKESEAQLKSREAQVEEAQASVASQKTQVEKASANIDVIQAKLQKMVMISPISGVISVQEAKVGEMVAPNVTVVAILAGESFSIKAQIPEVDIAKIQIEDKARVTLDAYGSDVIFEAKVRSIDPAETLIDGVPTYKTTFQFMSPDDRIKSGMTANIDILTEERVNILAIPERAIIREKDKKIVRVLNDMGMIEIREVVVGLRGSDGNTEIIEGLEEGQKVIIFFEEEDATH